MTVQQITLDGKPYPILFGYGALLDYETRFGSDPLEDLASRKSLARVTIQIAFSGLANGQWATDRTQPLALELQDLANLLTEAGKVEEILALFTDSMPKAEEDAEKKPTAAETGATASPATSGKN